MSQLKQYEAAPVPSTSPPRGLDPGTLALYEPAGIEDFRQRRFRVDREETLHFGPRRSQVAREAGSEPYDVAPKKPEEEDLISHAFVV